MSTAISTLQDSEAAGIGGLMATQSVSSQIQMATAMIDKQIATARAFPRSIAMFKEECTDLLTNDVETARSAEYAKPVGGGTVKGPSIRLAELAAMCWGNLNIEVSDPVVTDNNVIVKATAWDLQRNLKREAMMTTSIRTKTGGRYGAAMIETAIAATSSKAVRNAIVAIIPRAYINDLLEVAKKVASGNEKPLEQRRIDSLDYFARTYKVKPEQVFTFLGVEGIDDITGEHLDDLRAAITAIKEGTAKVEEFFPTPGGTTKADEIRQKLADREANKTAGATTNGAATSPPPPTVPPVASEPAAAATVAEPEKAPETPNAGPQDDKTIFLDLWKTFLAKGGLAEDILQGAFADENDIVAKCNKAALQKKIRFIGDKISQLK